MAGWYDGVKETELNSIRKTFSNGFDMAGELMPVRHYGWKHKGTVPRGEGGFGMTFTGVKYSHSTDASVNNGDAPDKDDDKCDKVRFAEKSRGLLGLLTEEKEEFLIVMDHLAKLKSENHDFVVGFAPKTAVNECIAGLHYNHAILYPEGDTNEMTVPHEIFHEYELRSIEAGCTNEHNNDGQDIEGFRVLYGLNKSHTEGNTEAERFKHFMCDKKRVVVFH